MKTFVLVGLGNPGERFTHTRHNLGRRVVTAFSDPQVETFFPPTFMNESGEAVASFIKEKALTPSQLIIVHDDLELPFGEVRWKEGGSANGHNGVRSIQEKLSTQEILRLRIGIGRPADDTPIDEFVLQRFSESEEAQLPGIIERAVSELRRRVFPEDHQDIG